jgi:hypothetical protein
MSVPQIDAIFVRTGTSRCPIVGTGTVSSERPGPALIFRNAFMTARARTAVEPNIDFFDTSFFGGLNGNVAFRQVDSTDLLVVGRLTLSF